MENKLVIGIDATNIRGGGGATHLIELLANLDPEKLNIKKVVLWTGAATSSLITNKDWLVKVNPKMLNMGLFFRTIWQIIFLSKSATSFKCDVIYVPGGSFFGSFKPVVSMSQNLLPFETSEYQRFGISKTTLRFVMLRFSQSQTFKKSSGVIFLTEYARKVVENITGELSSTIIIPHGVSSKFYKKPKLQLNFNSRSESNPIKVLYVSIINQYKHQWNVVDAIADLRKKYNYPIELSLVGPSFPSAKKKLDLQIDLNDPNHDWINYIGPVDHSGLADYYFDADIGVFASSCENLPIILLEKMAAGLPIASSNKGPMPDVLGDSGVYFDPEKSDEIASSILNLITSHDLRDSLSSKSFAKSKSYKWDNCSHDTFNFLCNVAKGNKAILLENEELLK
jgi:glycosyltransferase involved in cell wall biosynthesis